MVKSKQQQNIILIGPMGAGKSSVGKYIATQLGMEFYDTDEEIEKRTGVSISWIFDIEGPEGFSKREENLVKELVGLSNIVLATGGGTIVSPYCRDLLRENGKMIYLKVSLELQQTRTINESRRPLLQVPDREKVLIQLQEEREHLYEALADFCVLTDKRGIPAVGNDILNWLRERPS